MGSLYKQNKFRKGKVNPITIKGIIGLYENTMGVYVIAEAGVNHNGDMEIAKKLIDMAVEAGADAIKFQTFKAEECTGKYADKAEYQKNNAINESQIEMARKFELPFEYFKVLKEYAEKSGIDFLSTPDGTESLNYLIKIGISRIKISSTEVTNHQFLVELAHTGKPLILSTGMSSLGEVEKAVNVIKNAGNKDLILMHCTTAYPTDVSEVNLRAMHTMHKAFNLPVGYSDHTVTNEAAIAAVTMGAFCIEKHITIDKNLPGPDHRASMDKNEFKSYVKSIRNTEKLLGSGIKQPTDSELEIMKVVRRSILASRNISAGTILSYDDLCYKRPGDGIHPEYAEKIVGMRVNRDIMCEEKIMWQDLKG